MQIKKVGIILKKDSRDALKLAAELVAWFAERSVTAVIDQITKEMDILVILGGDGTLLHVADQAGEFQVPMVGINLGSLGFLTEVAVDEWREVLAAIMAGAAVVEERMMLKARLCISGQYGKCLYALNDVVISKGSIDQLMQLNTWADHEYITTYKADGLIFSTATGSTAYNLSAGGPIVQPEMQTILVTPICPFMLESRSILLPSSKKLTAALTGTVNKTKVIVDGRFAWNMQEGDLLEVQAAKNFLHLIRSPKKSYFDILRSKLNWGGRL